MIAAFVRIAIVKRVLLIFFKFRRRYLLNAFLRNNLALVNFFVKISSELSDFSFYQIAKRPKPSAHIAVKRAVTKSNFGFVGVAGEYYTEFLGFSGQYFHPCSGLHILVGECSFFNVCLFTYCVNNSFYRTNF